LRWISDLYASKEASSLLVCHWPRHCRLLCVPSLQQANVTNGVLNVAYMVVVLLLLPTMTAIAGLRTFHSCPDLPRLHDPHVPVQWRPTGAFSLATGPHLRNSIVNLRIVNPHIINLRRIDMRLQLFHTPIMGALSFNPRLA
jgi:hypothetical protein